MAAELRLYMKRQLFYFLILLAPMVADAQAPYERLGQKAMMSGDFSAAGAYFEKAWTANRENTNALYLMGYAYYHAPNYRKSIDAFDKLIQIKPTEAAAYYYRGKAKTLMFQQIKDIRSPEKGKLLTEAIKDFSTGIELSPDDMKFYQNRGLAYQEYGFYRSQKVTNIYNKKTAVAAANASIQDLQKVLSENGARRDIALQIQKSKQLLEDIR